MNLSEADGYKTMAEYGFESVDFSLMNSYNEPIWSWSDEELKKLEALERKEGKSKLDDA